MPITSSSTLEDIEGEYLDNVDYGDDLAKAKRFRAAIRALLVRKPSRSQLATMSIQFDMRLLKEQLDEVSAFVEYHPDNIGPSMTTSADLREYRS